MTMREALEIVLTQLAEEVRDTYGSQVDDVWAAIEHIAQQSQITTE